MKFLENKYYEINMVFIFLLAVYAISGLIIPLQFIVSNKFITMGITLMGIVMATYNIVIRKIFTKIRSINFLLIFFIANIITSLFVIKYGYLSNIKNIVVFYIYFFAIYPIFVFLKNNEKIKLIILFFSTITLFNIIAVFISIIQFIMLKGYKVTDYKGLVVRQGFMESRLFGILASPNYLSIVSLIIIIFLIVIIKKYKDIVLRTIIYFSILINFIYIVLSGSRTTFICLIFAVVIGCLSAFNSEKIIVKISKIIFALGVVLIGYYGIKNASEFYLTHEKYEVVENQKETLSLERTDTSEENISNNRFAIWKGTLQLVPSRPILGYSSGNWYKVAKEVSEDNYIVKEHYLTHNGYIEVLFYNGIIGFITIGLFIANLYIQLLKKTVFSKKLNCIYMGIISVITVILISNLFLSSTLYGISLLGIILFLLSGYYFSDDYMDENFEEIDINRVKEIELDIMDYVHNICRKNNINYSLGYGTLLGAVRHKGFIPWDDDVDICLLRNEYNKLFDIIKNDDNGRFDIISYQTNKYYPYPFYRIYDKNTYYINGYTDENKVCLGICVDVFPLDAYKNINKEISKLDVYRKLSAYTFKGIKSSKGIFINYVRYGISLTFKLVSPRMWNKKMNNLSMANGSSEYVDYLMEYKNKDTKLNLTWTKELIECSFEDRTYLIYKHYHEVLSTIYGSDYMEIPDESNRISHSQFRSYERKLTDGN